MRTTDGRGADRMGVGVLAPTADSGRGRTVWRVDRWDAEQTGWTRRRSGLSAPTGADFAALDVRPYQTTEHVGNLILNAGWTRLMNLLTNQGATQAFDSTHARIGAGNGSTAAAYTDTDLSAAAGSTNRWFQLVSGVATLGTRTLAYAATFGTADGNFAWGEFGMDFGTASGNTVTAPMFNRAVSSQGTKASGQTWTATATITWT
jgi:hypothetical protein